MRLEIRRSAAVALCALALSGTGCIVAAVGLGAAAGYGAAKYAENEFYQEFSAGLDDTWRATLASLRENGYPADPGAWHGANQGVIDAGDAHVVVEAHPGKTRVRVRVGTFENAENSRRAHVILEGVSNRVR